MSSEFLRIQLRKFSFRRSRFGDLSPQILHGLHMSESENPAPTQRILSIDALRGFDMFWIMGGDGFAKVLLGLTGT